MKVRYAPHMPFVLHSLACTFHGGLKTGIVGRTGSGKSTLIQTLFRIVEPTVGRIMIDGVNISSIGLRDLRSRLSIIPQDPTMFEGTVRSNLDPLEEYTDEQIWEVGWFYLSHEERLGFIQSKTLHLWLFLILVVPSLIGILLCRPLISVNLEMKLERKKES